LRFYIKIIQNLSLPIIFLLLGVFLNRNSIFDTISKKSACISDYDICFFGDSKNVWGIDYLSLKEKFPSKSFYNFSIGGASFIDMINMYGDNQCNCKTLIYNLHELTGGRDIIKNTSFFWSENLRNFDLFRPGEFLNPFKFSNKVYEKLNGFLIQKTDIYPSQSMKDTKSKYDVEMIKANIGDKYSNLSNIINDKKVVFIIYPDRDFREQFLSKNFGNTFLDSLYSTYFQKHPLIDFRKIKTLKKDSFYVDSHHLNKKGSKYFTLSLIDSLVSYGYLNY